MKYKEDEFSDSIEHYGCNDINQSFMRNLTELSSNLPKYLDHSFSIATIYAFAMCAAVGDIYLHSVKLYV